MIIEDKHYFITRWKKSVFALILLIFVVLMDDGLYLKWIILALFVVLFSISREIVLNEIHQSIDISLNIIGFQIKKERIPIYKIWEFSIQQNSTNRYELVLQKTSGEKIVLLTEILKNEIDHDLFLLREFTGI